MFPEVLRRFFSVLVWRAFCLAGPVLAAAAATVFRSSFRGHFRTPSPTAHRALVSFLSFLFIQKSVTSPCFHVDFEEIV